MRKIAILGGTFNPIHNGHLKLAENAWRQFALDACWFMPAPTPPHKDSHMITSYADRLAMVRAALEPFPCFEASDFEAQRSGKSYTSDTLRELAARYPEISFSFVLGADSFYEIESWHCPELILKYAGLIVADRDYSKNHESLSAHAEHLRARYHARIDFIHAEEVDISSEHIRRLFASGRGGAERLIPSAVYDYIRAHHLYGQ